MSGYKERMEKEITDLQEKYEKLDAFGSSSTFKDLSVDDQVLLKLQGYHMMAYLEILRARLSG